MSNENISRCPEEFENILEGLSKELNIADAMYIIMSIMEREDIPEIDTEGISRDTGLCFKLHAELSLDDGESE